MVRDPRFFCALAITLDVRLTGKLLSSRYDAPEDVQHIAECFDKSTKLSFKDPSQPSFIKFGTSRDTDPSVDVKFGQLKMSGSVIPLSVGIQQTNEAHRPDMVTLFEPSIMTIQDAINHQINTASARITVSEPCESSPFLSLTTPRQAVLMVGGFAASYWLFSKLQTYLQGQGIRFVRPDGHLYVPTLVCLSVLSKATCRGKAVADGAVLSVVDQSISLRASANDTITPWVGDAVASLLEDARDAKNPSMVIRAAVETCLINCSRHLVHGGNRNEGIRQAILTFLPKTGRSL
jgi:hypothetical protein